MNKLKIAAIAVIAVSVVVAASMIAMYEMGKPVEIQMQDDVMDDKKQVVLSVKSTIATFEGDLNTVKLNKGSYYSFVLDEDITMILAHPREELVNTAPTGLYDANISVEEMANTLDREGKVWIFYDFMNPETGNVEPKTTYLEKHENYIFGAGFYSP